MQKNTNAHKQLPASPAHSPQKTVVSWGKRRTLNPHAATASAHPRKQGYSSMKMSVCSARQHPPTPCCAAQLHPRHAVKNAQSCASADHLLPHFLHCTLNHALPPLLLSLAPAGLSGCAGCPVGVDSTEAASAAQPSPCPNPHHLALNSQAVGERSARLRLLSYSSPPHSQLHCSRRGSRVLQRLSESVMLPMNCC